MVLLCLFLFDKMVLLFLLNVIYSFLLVFPFSDIDRMILHMFQYLFSFLSNNIFPLFFHMLFVFQNVLIVDDHASCTLLLPFHIFLLLVIVFLPSSYTIFHL